MMDHAERMTPIVSKPLLWSPANSTCSTAAPDSDEEELDISEFVIVKRQKSHKRSLKAAAQRKVSRHAVEPLAEESDTAIPTIEEVSVHTVEEECQSVRCPVVVSGSPGASGKTASPPKPTTSIATILVALILPALVIIWAGLMTVLCALVWSWIVGSSWFFTIVYAHAVVWITLIVISGVASLTPSSSATCKV